MGDVWVKERSPVWTQEPGSNVASVLMWGLFHLVGSWSFISEMLAGVPFSRIVKKESKGL